ncbi:MAG: hypothetical protein WC477_04920 [Patescibacteria group bacterium]
MAKSIVLCFVSVVLSSFTASCGGDADEVRYCKGRPAILVRDAGNDAGAGDATVQLPDDHGLKTLAVTHSCE